MIADTFGKTLRKLREENKLTAPQLSKKTYITAPTIRKYERGDRSPSLANADELLRALGYRLAIVKIKEDQK